MEIHLSYLHHTILLIRYIYLQSLSSIVNCWQKVCVGYWKLRIDHQQNIRVSQIKGFTGILYTTHLLFHRVNIRFNISNEALRSEHATKPSGVGLMLNNLKYIPDKYKTPPLLTMMATEPCYKRDQKTHFSTHTKLNWSNFKHQYFNILMYWMAK